MLLHLALGLHGLAAVLHAAKVGLLALEAEIEGAVVHGEADQVVEVDVALGDDAALPIVALFNGFDRCELADLCLEVQCLADELRKSWHLVAGD